MSQVSGFKVPNRYSMGINGLGFQAKSAENPAGLGMVATGQGDPFGGLGMVVGDNPGNPNGVSYPGDRPGVLEDPENPEDMPFGNNPFGPNSGPNPPGQGPGLQIPTEPLNDYWNFYGGSGPQAFFTGWKNDGLGVFSSTGSYLP